jgi:predicted O-linked N-acetylglucosamine transferase (SPINDLY family)
MAGLDRSQFEPIYLGPGKPDNSYTAKSWQERGSKAIFYDENDMHSAIETVAAQKLDIVLSAPSQPAVFYPVMAKLAPLHMVVLEPNWTDGFSTSDYYISWRPAEPPKPEKFYRSKVAYLDHPPYWIDNRYDTDLKISERKRQAVLTKLTGKKPEERVYLCPSTPPKLHSLMDDIILGILKKDPAAIVTFLRNDFPPARNLHIRWREKFGKRYERIRFLPTLDRSEAHLLLRAVDCNLDSYPIGGMSSSFDGAILGIPTVTWPADIPFGRWLASIYEYIGVSGLTASSRDCYVDLAVRLATDRIWHRKKALEIKSKSNILIENPKAIECLQSFLLAAWKRHSAGLSNANWMSGFWSE